MFFVSRFAPSRLSRLPRIQLGDDRQRRRAERAAEERLDRAARREGEGLRVRVDSQPLGRRPVPRQERPHANRPRARGDAA